MNVTNSPRFCSLNIPSQQSQLWASLCIIQWGESAVGRTQEIGQSSTAHKLTLLHEKCQEMSGSRWQKRKKVVTADVQDTEHGSLLNLCHIDARAKISIIPSASETHDRSKQSATCCTMYMLLRLEPTAVEAGTSTLTASVHKLN